METSDAQIGANLGLLRRGKSQKEVADDMRERGWKWSQATVWSVEKGERPLRLAEAVDLAVILSTEVTMLFETRSKVTYLGIEEQIDTARQSLVRELRAYRMRVRVVVEGAAHVDLDPEDEREFLEELQTSPAVIFAQEYSTVRDTDWTGSRIGATLTNSHPRVKAELDLFHQRMLVMKNAWEQDFALMRDAIGTRGEHKETP